MTKNGFVSVRPEGACHQRRRISPRKLSVDLVADERLHKSRSRLGGDCGAEELRALAAKAQKTQYARRLLDNLRR